jgi:hypothetical protein
MTGAGISGDPDAPRRGGGKGESAAVADAL